MPWPPEIEDLSKILARDIYRRVASKVDPVGRFGQIEDEHVEKAWIAYKENATRIMAAMRAALNFLCWERASEARGYFIWVC